MKISISKLKPFDKNARIHPENQIEALRGSLQKFGQFRNVVIDEDNVILAGHGLVEAMKREGMTQVEAKRIEGLSYDQKLKLMLVDNRTQDMGRENMKIVEEIIREINDTDIPGFSEDALNALLMEAEEASSETQKFIDTEYEKMYDTSDDDEEDEGPGFLAAGEKTPMTSQEFSRPRESIPSYLPNDPDYHGIGKSCQCPHCKGELWV
jgi:hypothetical protein